MYKTQLLKDLENYVPSQKEGTYSQKKITDFIKSEPNGFYRTNLAGHVTGSALLINPKKKTILLNYHKKLDKWLCFGGHADGNNHIPDVACRETVEESGIETIDFMTPEIFDIDVHTIPEDPVKNEPQHFHYDIAYLLQTDSEDFQISEESVALKWVPYQEAAEGITDARMIRMFGKTTPFFT